MAAKVTISATPTNASVLWMVSRQIDLHVSGYSRCLLVECNRRAFALMVAGRFWNLRHLNESNCFTKGYAWVGRWLKISQFSRLGDGWPL